MLPLGYTPSICAAAPPTRRSNRVRVSGLHDASDVSSAAWLDERGWIAPPEDSHLDTIRSLTPRWAANARTLIRRASRSARISLPVHFGMVVNIRGSLRRWRAHDADAAEL